MSTSSKTQRLSVKRSGAILPIIAAALVALGALGFFVYITFLKPDEEVVVDAIFSEVTKGEFVAKVLDQGEIQSAENVEIKCNVGSRNGNVTVIDVVDEGTAVSSGDWLVTLDSTSFEKELEQQKLAVSNAETQVIQSQSSLDAAIESKKEYQEGTYLEQLRTIDNDIFNAEQELTEADAYLAHSIKLQGKGFITQQQLRSDEIAVAKARNSVELAKKRKDVLMNITKKKDEILLDADIAAAKAQVKNAEESLRIEEQQLAEIEEQLAFCSIKVPDGVSGEVVYHKEFDRRGGSEWVLEPGATVRERQVLIKLPNPDKMEVKVRINEQSITAIRKNMPATISVDALNSKSLTGFVTKVNSYAEQGGWGSSSSVREYAVYVRILNPPDSLISGMNASVSIQTEFQEDVLQAPLQCIYAANDTNFVLRRIGDNQFETVEVKIAGENSQNVWIESGVNEGDSLVMDPGKYKELMDLPTQTMESKIELPEGTAMTSDEDEKAPGKEGKKEDGKKKGPGGAMGGFDPGRIIDSIMDRYDTNSDGVIDAEEQKEFDERASRMTAADKDGDGSISKDEVKTYMDEMMKRFQGGGGGGRGGRN